MWQGRQAVVVWNWRENLDVYISRPLVLATIAFEIIAHDKNGLVCIVVRKRHDRGKRDKACTHDTTANQDSNLQTVLKSSHSKKRSFVRVDTDSPGTLTKASDALLNLQQNAKRP